MGCPTSTLGTGQRPSALSHPQGDRLDDKTAAIKDAVDIVDLIGERIRLEPHGGKFRGLCPFHDDHKPSLTVDSSYGRYNCWACGAKGDIFSFLQEMDRISFVDAKQRLAERAGIALCTRTAGGSDPKQLLIHVLDWAQEEFRKCLFDPRTGSAARQYLHGRGLTEETARNHRLGFAPDSFNWLIERAEGEKFSRDLLLKAGLAKVSERGSLYVPFRNRLVFPIRDERKNVIGFGGRALPLKGQESGPKYLNSPATAVYNKSQVLYGLDVVVEGRALAQRSAALEERVVIVMEGYTDCLMAYQHGIGNAVATCGTALTARHVALLRRHADRVVLMFDGDAAGRKAAREATALFLGSELDLRLCPLPDGQDPCDFLQRHGADDLRARVGKAVDALDYRIREAERDGDPTSLEGRRKVVEEVLQTLSLAPLAPREAQAIKYQLALTRVADWSGIGEAKLRRRIDELRNERTKHPRRVTGPDSRPASDTASGSDRESAEVQEPMDERERTIVQLLVSQPGRSGVVLPLYPAEEVRHPVLRRLTEACHALYGEMGERASVDALRERLDDVRFDAEVMDLCDGAPQGDNFDQGIRDVTVHLTESRKRFARSALRRLTAETPVPEQLEELRRMLKGSVS